MRVPMLAAAGWLLLLGCSSTEPSSEGAGGALAASGSSGGPSGGTASGGTSQTSGGASASGGQGGASPSGAGGKLNTGAGGNAGDSAIGGTTGDAGAPSIGSPAVRWLGRVQETTRGARFAWPGTGFTARFRGTGLSAQIGTTGDEDDFFQLIVDGKVGLLTIRPGQDTYELAKGLNAADEHTLTLWRRTESLTGVIEVADITVSGGELLPPAPKGKLLEVIGDSITVGFGVDCGPEDSFSNSNENNYLTYEAVAARALGADLFVLAWTGIGMLRDDDGQQQQQMPERYLRTIATESNSKWGFSAIPDAVVVALGTNDFALGDPGTPFVSAYTKFLDDMRGRYPNARIYLAGSPMIEGGDLVEVLTSLREARSAKGDRNVAVIDFQPPADDGWGCGHPNAKTHQTMAALLQQTLVSDLDW